MITGRSTRLRLVQPSDIDLLERWQDDPTVMRWWGHPEPLVSRIELERDLAGRLADTTSALHLIIETLAGKPVGRLDVERIDARHRSAEIAMYIGETTVQGMGLGSDALATVSRYLFAQRGLHRIALTVITDNHRAIGVYERLGFRREGRLRWHLWMDGMPMDEIAMSLLSDELRGID